MTLFDLLGYHIKANPKYGSEKKGQPTTYYLSAAPEPIRDQLRVLLRRRRALARPERLPPHQRAGRPEGRRRVHHPERPSRRRSGLGEHPAAVPADHHRQEDQASSTSTRSRSPATRRRDPELQLRMQGIAFQGAFFAASPVIEAGRPPDERAARRDPRPAAGQVRRQGRARRRGQHARRQARLRRGHARSPHGAAHRSQRAGGQRGERSRRSR